MSLMLSPCLDINSLARAYAAKGRLHIPEAFEPESAERLKALINEISSWNLVFDANGKHYDLDASAVLDLAKDHRERLMSIVHAQAASGFAYLYENCPFYDIFHHGVVLEHPMFEVLAFLNSAAFLDFARQVTGAVDIAFADGQATRYGPGHFLTKHDDGVEGKRRRAAFVINMTENWRPDWGGHLNFFDADGHIEEGYNPTFNAINIFSVPAHHSVGYVAQFAGAKRLSVTGWFRAGKDPMRRR